VLGSVAEDDMLSEALEWERSERSERRREAEELGEDGEKRPLFLPTPSFMASAEEE
jgi:hypothetical protein